MKLFKSIVTTILLIFALVIAGCGGDKIAGTWYAIDGDELQEFIIEKHNDTYLMTATKYKFEKWYLPGGKIKMDLDSKLKKENIFSKQNITFKDDVISYPLMFGQSANLIYKDKTIRGNIYGSFSKTECVYKKSDDVKLDDLIKQLEENEKARLKNVLDPSSKINFIVDQNLFKNNNAQSNS